MLTIEKTVTPSADQWEIIIEGMRNPKNSWNRSDSFIITSVLNDEEIMPGVVISRWVPCEPHMHIGDNDLDLMTKLTKGGPVHAKYRRMIPVYVTLTAPLYFWKEMDTYKVGTVRNSCSTMHKIHAKPFDRDDFSMEHLYFDYEICMMNVIKMLNIARDAYLESKDKSDWWQMIQLLPSSYNQKATLMLNYEVLHSIYIYRKTHKLDEWHTFCEWIKGLPHSELITCEDES